MNHDHPPRITLEEFRRLCDAELPFLALFRFAAEEIGYGRARCRLPANDAVLRPGGTISGPAQMALADFALYAAVLGAVGYQPMAVTSNLSINFVMRPAPGDLIAHCQLFKLGKRLAVGEVRILDHEGRLASHVTGTYSIPPA